MSYRPFVIISYLRSGTHLLRTALESHPAIVCQTEVFNSDNPRLPYPLETPTETILAQWVYRTFPTSVQRVGFVLQAYHPYALQAFPGIRSNPHWENIWSILAEMEDLQVIQLRRHNLLRRHLSHVMARQTGQWHYWERDRTSQVTHLEPPPSAHIGAVIRSNAAITLDPVQLQTDFEEVERWQNRAYNLLSHQPILQIAYEQLCEDFDRTGQTVLHFLDVEPKPLISAVKKLEARTLADSITNYAALKTKFAHTEWAHFFEEQYNVSAKIATSQIIKDKNGKA